MYEKALFYRTYRFSFGKGGGVNFYGWILVYKYLLCAIQNDLL